METHIIWVSIIPAEPTKAPLIINKWLFSTKPVAQAANPEYEFSRETTTGISALPMGITSKIPKIKLSTVINKTVPETESIP